LFAGGDGVGAGRVGVWPSHAGVGR
jgi:hypothetical protein